MAITQPSQRGGDRKQWLDGRPTHDGGHGVSPPPGTRSRPVEHRGAVLDVLVRPVFTTLVYPLIDVAKRQR